MQLETAEREKFNRLWQRAEDILQKRWAAAGAISAEDVDQAVHELQVYQIELELQNEELRRTQAELETARDKYADLYDFAPLGYFTLDQTGRVVEANLKAATMLGVLRDALIGHPLYRFVAPHDQDAYHLYLRGLAQATETQSCEIGMIRLDGSMFHARLDGFETEEAMQGEGGEPSLRYRLAVSDITQHKQAEEALVRSERLAARASLAALLAHEIKNPLQAVVGCLGLAQEALAEREEPGLYLNVADEELKRMVSMVNQMLDLHSQSDGENLPGLESRTHSPLAPNL